jgi:hypothetical protein
MAVSVTVHPSTTKLIALANLKAILGIADSANDELLGNIIQRGSDAIARFCNRVFAQRTVVDTLPGSGGQLRRLKFSPIVTLTSIAYDGETVDSDSYTLIEPAAGIVFCESSWAYTGHKYSYTATYVHIPVIPATQSSAKLPRHRSAATPGLLGLCCGHVVFHEGVPFTHRISSAGTLVRVMEQSVKDRVSERRIPKSLMPVLNRELTGDNSCAAPVSIVQEFEYVASVLIIEGGKSPIIENQ